MAVGTEFAHGSGRWSILSHFVPFFHLKLSLAMRSLSGIMGWAL